jgi:hypothetical protein
MRSHLHNRVSKIEQAVMASKVKAGQRDPELVSFLEKFGIPLDRTPSGISAKEYLDEVFKNLKPRIFMPVKSEEESAEIARRLEMFARRDGQET